MTAYNYLFWGFIITFININIGINLMPDFIGYIIIVIGLTKLVDYSTYFSKGKLFAFILIFYSIPNFFGFGETVGGHDQYQLEWSWLLFEQLGVLLQLFLIGFICYGIVEHAKKSELNELVEVAIFRWKLLLTVSALQLALTPFLLNFDLLLTFLFLIMIMMFIFFIVFLHLLRKAYREFTN
ncbi:hypothetical protein QA612_16605 [Evansella sp. AB-P1]|uniref:hypothetical protein n=1 Tax=Evansella sp. AB-P1 TaxID=3037653 RepID=UPI0024201BF7|nr:hypothetical protein [Evansella sp. AB-P1]MDG5789079.1 hypothetical protein [Evansella sp. AB-P1]